MGKQFIKLLINIIEIYINSKMINYNWSHVYLIGKCMKKIQFALIFYLVSIFFLLKRKGKKKLIKKFYVSFKQKLVLGLVRLNSKFNGKVFVRLYTIQLLNK